MNTSIISQFSDILVKLTAILSTLASLVGPGTPALPVSHHFGASNPPNVAATTTVTMNQTIPYVSTIDQVGGVINLSSSSFYQNSLSSNAASSGVQLGNNTQFNQVSLWVTATTTAFGSALLGPVGSTTSTTSTVIGITQGIPTNGLFVGDPCWATMALSNTTATALNVFPQCTITSVATTTASSTLGVLNGSSSVEMVPSGAIFRLEIHHLAF